MGRTPRVFNHHRVYVYIPALVINTIMTCWIAEVNSYCGAHYEREKYFCKYYHQLHPPTSSLTSRWNSIVVRHYGLENNSIPSSSNIFFFFYKSTFPTFFSFFIFVANCRENSLISVHWRMASTITVTSNTVVTTLVGVRRKGFRI